MYGNICLFLYLSCLKSTFLCIALAQVQVALSLSPQNHYSQVINCNGWQEPGAITTN